MLRRPRKHDEALSALALSEDEVQRLMEDKTPAIRLAMTNKIAGAYGESELKGGEASAAEQIFRLLLRDTELRVRVALAEHVKNSTQIPRDIVMTLARDVEEVALPVLQYSEVLTDEDLIELMNNTQETAKFIAVSKRASVSDRVTDTLLEKGDEKVALTLISNGGARISDKGLGKIVDRYPANEKLMLAVSNHPRLPVTVAEKMVHVVSSSLATVLKKKYKLPEGQLQKEVDKTRESETLSIIRQSQSQEDIEKLIAQLVAFERLTPSIILSALCQGNFAFFETSLARLSNIPVSNARALIGDRGELGFRAIYNKSGLTDAMFPAVKLLLRVVRQLDEEGEKPGSPRYPNRVVERLLAAPEAASMDNLSYIIALVRQVTP